MLAEMDATGWSVIIGAACVGVGGIVTSALTLYFGFVERGRAADREHAKIERDRIAAEKVEAVRKQAELAARKADLVAEKTDLVAAKADLVAEKTAEVKTTLEAATASTDGKLDQIHILVNSRLSKALDEIARLSAQVATLSGTPLDKALADKASIDARKKGQ